MSGSNGSGPRRVKYPGPEYPRAWVELPAEWLGAHLLRRDEAARATADLKNQVITVAAIALAVANDWDGIPGLEGRDPAKWDFSRVPIALLRWLEEAVLVDFALAFVVPKNSLPPLPEASKATAGAETTTAGASPSAPSTPSPTPPR